MLRHVLAILLLCAIPVIVQAQSEDETPVSLAGDYTVHQTYDDESMDGTMTLDGTGPIYALTATSSDGQNVGSVVALAQDDLVAASGGNDDCAPAMLIRQKDGTLFGQWIDTTASAHSLGIEYYTPQRKTTDFAGTYDFVGSYANGAQYKGTLEITRGENGIYNLEFAYTSDESTPDRAIGIETGTGIADENTLGYAFTDNTSSSCNILLLKFAADGNFSGRFTSGSTVGQVSGAPAS